MARKRSYSVFCCLAFFSFTGCVPLPPRGIPISDVPESTGASCTFTMVRDSQLVLTLNNHYISLDGEFIASLGMSEYTRFSVPEGPHVLGVTWRVIDEDSLRYRVLVWKDLSKTVDVICEPPMAYLFTTTQGFPWYPEEMAILEQVDEFVGGFSLVDKAFVPPGAPPSNR